MDDSSKKTKEATRLRGLAIRPSDW